MTTENITIGLDLGDRRHAACVLSAAGTIIAEEAITNTRECLTVFAQLPTFSGHDRTPPCTARALTPTHRVRMEA